MLSWLLDKEKTPCQPRGSGSATTEIGVLTLPPRRGDSTKGILVPLIGLETFAATRRPLLHHYEFDRWSTLATHLPSLCLGDLFSPSDPWYSYLTRRHISRLRPNSVYYNVLLSRTHTTSVLCRWLAGMNQRITPPLFYLVNFLQIIFLLLSLSSYIIPWLASKVKGLLIFFLPSKKGSRVEVFWLTPWTFRKYGFGTSRKHLITFLTFKFHFHNQSLVWVYYSFLSVTQEGNRTHHFNPPIGWAPRLFRAINPQRCRWLNRTHYLFLF